MTQKYNENGFMILEDDTEMMVNCVLRMKAGTSKFRKQFGEDAQKFTVDTAEIFEAVKKTAKEEPKPKKAKDTETLGSKIWKTVSGIAQVVLPAVLPKLLGMSVNFDINDGGFNFDAFFD